VVVERLLMNYRRDKHIFIVIVEKYYILIDIAEKLF